MTTAPRQNQYRGSAPDLGADSEFGRLVAAVCNGTLTRLDRDRLETLLADPAVRAAYRDQLRLHAHLVRLWHAGASEAVDGGEGSAAGDRSRAGSLGQRAGRSGDRFAAAVAVVRATLAGWLRKLAQPLPIALFIAGSFVAVVLIVAASVRVPPLVASDDSAVRWPDARITGVHDAKWRSPKASFGFADPLYAGTMLDLESGLVELRFDCGATVVLEGPATLRIESRKESQLSRGRLTAKLEKAGDADQAAARRAGTELPRLFTIHTPKASVHDLGTEFGVDVREAGDADVHVFNGLVELASVGGIASASDAAAFRLAAGDAARIDEAGRITSTGGGQARKFVRAMPKPERDPRSLLERLGWSDAAAEVIYHDPFAGSGPLAGTMPAARGGIGNDVWIAQPQGWYLRDGSLIAESAGSALIPFRPEPGWLYRLTVPFNVAAGSKGWCAIGFKTGNRPTSNHGDDGIAWMLRGHPSDTQHIQEVFAGSGIREKVAHWNRCRAAQTFSILLDTTDPQWRAHFLVDGVSVAVCRYSSPQTMISCAGISILSTALVRIDSFVLERAAKQQPGEPAVRKTGHTSREKDKP